jgi:hypothetical protein
VVVHAPASGYRSYSRTPWLQETSRSQLVLPWYSKPSRRSDGGAYGGCGQRLNVRATLRQRTTCSGSLRWPQEYLSLVQHFAHQERCASLRSFLELERIPLTVGFDARLVSHCWVAPRLASLSAASLPSIPVWPGVQLFGSCGKPTVRSLRRCPVSTR